MGFNIIVDNYFSIGDVIRIGDVEGKVLELGLKATKIKDINTDGILVIANRNITQALNISNVMERLLPKKMIPVFLDTAQIPEDKKIRDISKKERRRMIELMKNFEMHISGVRGFNEAIVTRGGVNVKEINPATMESKKVKHLFFAGEIMDLDAVTGGYNLQIAWSTGHLAGESAAEE